jgi:hypothetical protein
MSYTVGAYWGPRKESRQDCASRISVFLHALTAQDAALSRWYRLLGSRKEPLRELPHDVDALLPLLGVNRRDIGREIIVELGFDFTGWNGWKAELPASLSLCFAEPSALSFVTAPSCLSILKRRPRLIFYKEY